MNDPTKDIFTQAISLLTHGLIPDLTTAAIAMVVLTLLWIGLDLLTTMIFGQSIGDKLAYIEYRSKRSRSERFRAQYETDKLNSRSREINKGIKGLKWD